MFIRRQFSQLLEKIENLSVGRVRDDLNAALQPIFSECRTGVTHQGVNCRHVVAQTSSEVVHQPQKIRINERKPDRENWMHHDATSQDYLVFRIHPEPLITLVGKDKIVCRTRRHSDAAMNLGEEPMPPESINVVKALRKDQRYQEVTLLLENPIEIGRDDSSKSNIENCSMNSGLANVRRVELRFDKPGELVRTSPLLVDFGDFQILLLLQVCVQALKSWLVAICRIAKLINHVLHQCGPVRKAFPALADCRC